MSSQSVSSAQLGRVTCLVFIGADTRQDDVILLPPLEAVNTGHLNLRVQLLTQLPIAQHHLQSRSQVTLKS